MSTAPRIEAARDLYQRRSWAEAYEAFAAADGPGALAGADLERLARAAEMVGRGDAFVGAMERACRAYRASGETLREARAAFWIGMRLAEHGQMGPATGWLGRARRLVEAEGGECVEGGYLLVAAGFRAFAEGDGPAGVEAARRAVELAERFREPDLRALALHLQGRALLRMTRVREGLALLDEAMVAVVADELSPHVTGLVYCSVISACRDAYALSRAREWTAALEDWCDRQPGLVAYTDECRVNRAAILHLQGDWSGCLEEARRASASGASRGARGAALYQEGEVHRARGHLAAAEEAYRGASRLGREPQPGLALLRLGQGDARAAAAAIRRVLAGETVPGHRARLLPACIEILLATGTADAAEEAGRACGELEGIAAAIGTDYLEAAAGHARGAVELARGQAGAACVALREGVEAWWALGAPYQAARARELLGLACRELGDEEAARLEMDAAREIYERLSATADLARLNALGPVTGHGLTPRERDVLAELATGKTNRAIARHLYISEKTVARHVSNIFSKLGLSSRAAATAYAYQHDLLTPPA